jgi:hypothetical protein
MRFNAKHFVIALAAFVLAMPVFARNYKGVWNVAAATTIGTTQMSVGDYQLSADDSKPQLTILQRAKVFATVPGQWVKLPKKADYTSVLVDGGKVTQIQFGGSDQAFQPQ